MSIFTTSLFKPAKEMLCCHTFWVHITVLHLPLQMSIQFRNPRKRRQTKFSSETFEIIMTQSRNIDASKEDVEAGSQRRRNTDTFRYEINYLGLHCNCGQSKVKSISSVTMTTTCAWKLWFWRIIVMILHFVPFLCLQLHPNSKLFLQLL